MKKNKLSTQLTKTGQRLANRAACYFNGQQIYNLNAEPLTYKHKTYKQKAYKQKASTKPWLLVLARSCYQEQVNSYPIKSASELKQLLELQRPSSLLTRYFIGPYENNQRLVHEIIVDAAYLTVVEQARFLLPETLLLAKFAPLGLTTIELGPLLPAPQPASPKLWFHRGPQQSAAVMQGGLLSNEVSARVALGVHSAEPTHTWAFGHYLTLLSENWWRLPTQWWPAARNAARSQQAGLPWAAMLGASVAMLLLYASISSSYLHFANQWRSNKMQHLSSDVMQHLVAREHMESDLEKLKVFAAASTLNAEQMLAWNIVAFLKQQSINLNQVSGDLNTIEVGGEVESATALVAQLNELPGVTHIEFVAPVRRGRNGEMFRLRIQLVAN